MNVTIGLKRRSRHVTAFFICLILAVRLPAAEINDLIFIHHSCGQNWLDSGLHDALLAKGYIDERNDITYGVIVPADPGRPASLGDVAGENTNMNHWILWFNDYMGSVKQFECTNGYNRIVMFKSCYPTSDIWDDGTEPGDPFSEDQTLANYKAVYRHPEAAGRKYMRDEVEYVPLEDVFSKHPEILFIPVTSPPLRYDATDDANAHRARLFANWLKNDWLSSYNKAHPALKNVAVYDWFNFLANADNASIGPNRLKEAYCGTPDEESHPNSTANAASTVAFATGANNFLDTAWQAYLAATDVGSSDRIPAPSAFQLDQNYPNPFNPSTTIRFSLPKTAHVCLSIYNLLGQEIAVLVDEKRSEGVHEMRWGGTDAEGRPLPSGVYLVRLETPFRREFGRLLLLK
ncbi:MAG TPA: FlgD immunoglobulin-like domain containing protein [bacterium]